MHRTLNQSCAYLKILLSNRLQPSREIRRWTCLSCTIKLIWKTSQWMTTCKSPSLSEAMTNCTRNQELLVEARIRCSMLAIAVESPFPLLIPKYISENFTLSEK